jgi:hypothetical protein
VRRPRRRAGRTERSGLLQVAARALWVAHSKAAPIQQALPEGERVPRARQRHLVAGGRISSCAVRLAATAHSDVRVPRRSQFACSSGDAAPRAHRDVSQHRKSTPPQRGRSTGEEGAFVPIEDACLIA